MQGAAVPVVSAGAWREGLGRPAEHWPPAGGLARGAADLTLGTALVPLGSTSITQQFCEAAAIASFGSKEPALNGQAPRAPGRPSRAGATPEPHSPQPLLLPPSHFGLSAASRTPPIFPIHTTPHLSRVPTETLFTEIIRHQALSAKYFPEPRKPPRVVRKYGNSLSGGAGWQEAGRCPSLAPASQTSRASLRASSYCPFLRDKAAVCHGRDQAPDPRPEHPARKAPGAPG